VAQDLEQQPDPRDRVRVPAQLLGHQVGGVAAIAWLVVARRAGRRVARAKARQHQRQRNVRWNAASPPVTERLRRSGCGSNSILAEKAYRLVPR
jgi:hypothetical protein